MKIKSNGKRDVSESTRIATARMARIIHVPALVTEHLTPRPGEDGPYNWENDVDWSQGEVTILDKWYSPLLYWPWEFLFEK